MDIKIQIGSAAYTEGKAWKYADGYYEGQVGVVMGVFLLSGCLGVVSLDLQYSWLKINTDPIVKWRPVNVEIKVT